MKDYYKINEISMLYGIGVDSLRYYETIGVLNPRRNSKGYRLYSLKDIYKLNVIRDLRRLDFSMSQIKDYLDHQSISHTVSMLRNEKKLVESRLKELFDIQSSINMRMDSLAALEGIVTGNITQITIPERSCYRLDEKITRDEETDFAVKKLHRLTEKNTHDFGVQTIGAVPSIEDFKRGVYNVFCAVFFICGGAVGQEGGAYDFKIEAGKYLSLFYRGDYKQSSKYIQEIVTYAGQGGLIIDSEVFELYHIDNRYTAIESEFLTEIQVKIV